MKVLFLTPWYPSERDAMEGLFVQKHVEAVRAQGVDVRVIYSQNWRDMWQQWRKLKRTWGLPDVVQLNVIQKQGALALWLKRRYGIPYTIIEHWTGYLPENMSVKRGSLHTRFMQRICHNAEVVMPVSAQLAGAMQALGFEAKRWQVINNVVDDFFYKRPNSTAKTPKTPDGKKKKILLNITCFDEPHKNVKGLLRAAKELSTRRHDWQLVLVGVGTDYQDVRAYSETLQFPEGLLRWTGELTPLQVAEEMQNANAFVLSSRFETYGVVLAEAAAAGLPIISTPVGIAEEVHATIVQQETANNHPDEFATTIEKVLFSEKPIEAQTVDTERFTFQAVGQQLKQIYESV